jgi:tetratricopeptide (TPR) repeat protein
MRPSSALRQLGRHIALASILSSTMLAHGQTPGTKAAPAQDQDRVRAELQRVMKLHETIDRLRLTGQFGDALETARELSAAYKGLKGHTLWGEPLWDEPGAKRLVASLERIVAMPAGDQARLAEAERLVERARQHYDQGRYDEAEPLYRDALAIRRDLLGKRDPDTAFVCHQLAINLGDQNRYTESETLFREALDIWRQTLGEGHPNTSSAYANLALVLDSRGRYAEAEPLCRAAIELARRSGGEFDLQAAAFGHILALNLDHQGRHAEAEPLYQSAVKSLRRWVGPRTRGLAKASDNQATNLFEQGRLAEAEQACRAALEIFKARLGDRHIDTARAYTNLGAILSNQGRLAEAEQASRTALEIYRATSGERHADTSGAYINLAVDLRRRGRHAEAEPLYRKALAIRRDALGEGHLDTALATCELAANLADQGRYAEAHGLWQQAAGALEDARLLLSLQGLDRALTAPRLAPWPALAALSARSGRPSEEAWRWYEAGLGRALWDELSDRRLRPLDERERRRHEELVERIGVLDQQIGRLTGSPAPNGADAERLKQLRGHRTQLSQEYREFVRHLEQAYEPAGGRIYDLEAIRRHLPPDTALVGWLDLEAHSKAADPDGEHWAFGLRHRGGSRVVKIVGTGTAGGWTEQDTRRGERLRQRLAQGQDGWQAIARDLAHQRLGPLASLIDGSDPAGLPPVRRLVVLPSPDLDGVPIELLIQARWPDSGIVVSRVSSGTLFAWLRQRGGDGDAPRAHRLLAIGDPVFDRPGSPAGPSLPDHGLLIGLVEPASAAAQFGFRAGEVLLSFAGADLRLEADLQAARNAHPKGDVPLVTWDRGQTRTVNVRSDTLHGLHFDPRQAPIALGESRQRGQLDALRRDDGSEHWRRLEGTAEEVRSIATVFGPGASEVRLRSKASEQELDHLARTGALARFGYIHLATHGQADERQAFRSRLILARDTLPDPLGQLLAGRPIFDGSLTAAEIRRTWRLNANLVTLSACETGLGRHAFGEGYLGFAQALISSGSRSVVLSLWKVDDQATALLMTRFYQNLLGRRDGLDGPVPKTEALDEAKRWLRGLTAEQIDRTLDRQITIDRP